jgi:RHS repeat-associated protein
MSSIVQSAQTQQGTPGLLLSSPETAFFDENPAQTTISYTYDSLYRLTDAVYSNGFEFHYTYDPVGNRLTQTTCAPSVPCATTHYEYDNANRLTKVGDVVCSWDDNGNLLSDGASTYAYDSQNRLTTLTQGGHTYAFGYNGQGDRLMQSVDGMVTYYALDLEAGLTQVLSDGSYAYLYGVARLAQANSSETDYFLGDALGSVRQLVDAGGAVRLAKNYEPYGTVMGSAGSGASVYGFTGEQQSADLVYLRARFYQYGHFLTRDTWVNYYKPSTLNSWNYSFDNPILYKDASGFSPAGPQSDILYPGYIEDRVDQAGVRLYGIWTHGQENWLRAAVSNVPALKDIYENMRPRLIAGEFSSGTLHDLYEQALEEAHVTLPRYFSDISLPETEYAHAALTVLAYIPPADGESWRLYPLFIPDGRALEPGWDKGGHFFLYAFTAFEGKYSATYTSNRELGDIEMMRSYVGTITGNNNLNAIEADYQANADAPYLSGSDLTGPDATIFNSLIHIGNAYELLTSLNHLPSSVLGHRFGTLLRQISPSDNCNSMQLMILMLADRVTNNGENINALVKALLAQPHTRDRNEGLMDSGVYRDQVANRLGIKFGLQVFSSPSVIPEIPYDVGVAGFESVQDNGNSAYRYEFPK